MKRMLALGIASAVLAGVAMLSSGEQGVFSRNVVGVVKIELKAGQWQLISTSLNPIQGEPTIVNILGDTVPEDTTVLFWDGTRYVGETYYGEEWGWWPGTSLLTRGLGFWMRSPVDVTLSFTGEVPSQSQTSVMLESGYNLVSFPYPVETEIQNSVLNTVAQDGDQILRYTGVHYEGATFYDGLGWWPADFKLKVGESYWYRSVAAQPKEWLQDKSYTYP